MIYSVSEILFIVSDSYLYKKLYFEYLNDYKADYEKADEYLEINKSSFPNYLYYKAILLINKNVENQYEGERLLEQFIQETDNDTFLEIFIILREKSGL